jgi:Berberine and berberine like
MKGARATKPRLEVAQKVFKTLIELTENRPGFVMSCSFEYTSLAKICSVANDATPCTRLPYPNVMTTIRWPENTEENLKFARDASRQLIDIVVKANVELTSAENTTYGNYGAFFRNFAKIARLRRSDPEMAVDNSDSEKNHKPRFMSSENYPRLQALKKKYDPEIIFSKWFAITPA